MKRKLNTTLLFTLCLTLLSSISVKAQKFAYVDSEYILTQMPAYKTAQAKLEELSKGWQSEIDAKFEEVDKMYKSYQAEKVLLNKDMQTKKENEIIAKEREAKKLQNDKFGYEGELFQKRQELIKPIQDKLFEAINKVAKQNGLDFMFDKSGDVLMLVVNKKYDRSDEVLEELGITPIKENKNNLPPAAGGTNSNLPDED